MGGAPVETLPVVAQQDGTVSPFSNGEVDGAGGARDEEYEGRLVALTDDPQDSMPPLSNAMSSILVSQASLTRRPFNPRSTAKAAWA